jgi:uncharacterized membrane protein YedE/YeeE
VKREAVAFASGALFGAGLCVSGMTRPAKVLGFLDFAGAWDPSLAFVMVGAIGVAAVAFRVSAKRAAPLLDDKFHTPDASARVDGRLLGGAALFGAGWGIAGLCPGPALVSLASGQIGAIVFAAAMLDGLALQSVVARRARQ